MNDYAKQTAELRQSAKDLLVNGTVQLVIGFRENEEAGSPSPLFARTVEDADLLCWNENCWRNLSPYVMQTLEKTAIAAKPCDIRALINLLSENQLKRENLVIIGMECNSMKKDGLLAPGCNTCPSSIPNLYDIAIGADGTATYTGLPMSASDQSVNEWHQSTSVADRHTRFIDEINRCILCFSCRQACPGCYCETCFVDRNMTPWQQADVDISDKIAFHLTRAMHLAGRCVGCGACENVCPSGVRLKYLYDGVNEFIDETYDFRAGTDPNATQAMNLYTTNDREIGFLGGETHDNH